MADRTGQVQQRIAHLNRIGRISSRVAGVLLLVAMCSALSVFAGLLPGGNYTGAAAVSLSLQFIGLVVVCGVVGLLAAAFFVTMVLRSAEHSLVALLGGALQVAIGLWLLVFVLQTPLNLDGLSGWLLIAACGLAFLVAGGALLASMWLRRIGSVAGIASGQVAEE